MKYIFLLLGMLLSVSQVFAQKPIKGLNLNIRGEAQAYHIPDLEQELNYLVINDRNNSSIYKLNAKMQLEDSIHQNKIDSKYILNTGAIIENSEPVLFWSTKNSTSIISQKFDFNSHQYELHTFDLNLKKEKILGQFTALNQLYILTVLDDSSLIKIYKFTDSKTVRTQLVNLGSYIFYDRDYKKQNLDQVLKHAFPTERTGFEPYELDYIDLDSPTPISLTANKKKFYIENNILTITLDHNSDHTELIRLDLTNNSHQQLYVKKPFIKSESRFELNSNSFLYKDRLVQIKTSTSNLFLTVKDLDGNLLSEFTANKKDELSFINGKPKIYMNNKRGGIKDVEKTAVLLNQLKNKKIAVSCFENQNGYNITFGATETATSEPSLLVSTSFGLVGSLVTLAYYSTSSNPMAKKLEAFKESQKISATVLTDKDFKSIPGTVGLTVYQKIHDYLRNKEIKSTGEVLFQFQEKMYLGYFDIASRKYQLLEFN